MNNALQQLFTHGLYHFSAEEIPNKFYGTLPKSWRQKNLVTAVKENEDPEEVETRRNLVKYNTPAELAQISGLSDIPVPSRITSIFSTTERKKRAEKKAARRYKI